ncbi:2-oxoglutarate and iron-dependent oxygenase JMJD4 homolog [Scaptodrosophila lebanonensis]|uniref:Jumonji domain-containing protein 4 n=1 Tax=Drosophila lebanonensis TaxID=7225 RepID=A0A6J2U8A2_DROLE|nr:2-oxoglutarate and iron-dependent oxygenase JMJD4 homolog [Scaptodrosophila lebanonensis]
MASDVAALALLLEPPPPGTTLNDKDASHICRRSASDLSYNDFYWQYMHNNWPVIITDVSNNWECRNWIRSGSATPDDKDDEANANINTAHTNINFDYLKSRIGDCLVPVADCNAKYFNSHAKIELRFYDFLARWRRSMLQKEHEQELNSNVIEKAMALNNLYLKDWHLAAQLPAYEFYSVPKYFASDWLNEQLVALKRDDYRFVYMGPRNSWTSYHADVFGSYSWSTNIVGRKKWLIMPPGEETKLADRLGNLPFKIDEELLAEQKVRFFTINQSANEAVFVPSGWFHQVWNETDTISVNHNWFNACNVPLVWRNLQTNMQAVRKEIADCSQMENFEAHCQTMLRASFGINYLDFIDLLEFIAARRLTALEHFTMGNKNSLLLFDRYTMNEYHLRYDLARLRQLLGHILEDETVRRSTSSELYNRCESLLQRLKQCPDMALPAEI